MTISGFVEYVKQIWKNKPDRTTPITAAALTHIEDGIKGNSDAINKIAQAVVDNIVNDPQKIASMAALYAVNESVKKNATAIETVNNNLESGYLKIKVYDSCIRLVQKTVSFTNGIGYIPLSEIFESFNPKYAIGVSQPIDLESEGIALVSVSKDGNNMKIALNKSYTGTKWVSFIAIGSL